MCVYCAAFGEIDDDDDDVDDDIELVKLLAQYEVDWTSRNA